jgi:lipopolysaccharide transport system ATP-binding protein
MSDPIAIEVHDLGKQYRRGLQLEPYKTAREALVRAGRRLVGRSNEPRSDADRWFWAVDHIDFELREGERLGIIGRNGAGKTTLLKVLSRITKPTTGYAKVHGRVGTLLEVGTGFHPELTGRENIRLNGAILGMPRRDIDRRFDEIVEFAEVGKFVDTPVKRYSSGMYVRLAFSVAAHLEPDVLIVDEVLAVGDAAFQKKCLGKLDEVSGEGRTILFVSHNMASVMQLCSRGILMEEGKIVVDGHVDEVVEHYMTNVAATTEQVTFDPDPAKAASFLRLATRNPDGEVISHFGSHERITLEAEFEAHRQLVGDHVWLMLYRADGLLMVKASDDDSGRELPEIREPGRYVVRFHFPPNLLNEGAYQFRVAIGKRRGTHHDDRYSGYFDVEDTTDYTESHFGKRNGVLLPHLDSEEERVQAGTAEVSELRSAS